MRNKFIAVPFALSGDVTAIPDAVVPAGLVSFTQGYGPDYARDLDTDPLAKSIDRANMNYLFNVISAICREWQTEAFPEWIDAASNAGVAFPYDLQTVVRWRALPADPFLNYVSLHTANTALPSSAADWQPLVTNVATALQVATGTDNQTIVTPLRLATALAGFSSSKYSPGDDVITSGSTPPTGTMAQNGAAVSRTVYAALFARIGTTYGVGDGVTTFNLPNLPDGYAILSSRTTAVGVSTVGDNLSHAHTVLVNSGSLLNLGESGNYLSYGASGASGGSINRAAGIHKLHCIAF